MRGLTDYITECDWGDVFTVWFVLVDDTFTQLYGHLRLRPSGPAPTFTDSEVITISLISDTYFHGNEELALAFVRQHYRALFPNLLSNGRFNRRRRALSACIEGVLRALSVALIDPHDALRLTDSAPIPVCTYQRGVHLPNRVGGRILQRHGESESEIVWLSFGSDHDLRSGDGRMDAGSGGTPRWQAGGATLGRCL